MVEKHEVLQTGGFSRCELNVLVDMYLDGHSEAYIAEVLFRDVADVEKQIVFKGLRSVRVEKRKADEEKARQERFKSIVSKHIRGAAA